MRSRKSYAVAALLAAATLTFAGCSKSDDTTDTEAVAETTVVAGEATEAGATEAAATEAGATEAAGTDAPATKLRPVLPLRTFRQQPKLAPARVR
jgi:hypothetical protein